MKTANLNYNSEINQLIELNKKLKTIFDGILKEYFKLKGINKNFKELSSEYFTNPNKRLEIMTDGIELLKNNNIKILDESDIEEMTIYYFEIDNQIAELQEQIRNKITNYEKACKNISNKEYSKEDISIYFECLIEAYNNYLNKDFEQEFSFKSSEMRESIHSLESKYGRKEIDIDLSISHDKVIHLMGLPSTHKKDNIFSKLYNSYLTYYPEVMDYIKNEIQKEKNNELESRMYMYFLQFIAPKYIEKILFDKENINEQEQLIIENCSIDSPKIEDDIKKSFEKIINFRKLFEYKMIPEIIIDYDIAKARNNEGKEYQYLTFSRASKPISKQNTIFLKDILIIDESSSKGYIFIEDEYHFTSEEKELIHNIIKELNTFNIYLPLDETGKRLKIENYILEFIVEDDSINIGGYDGKDSNLLAYNYFLQTNEIKSNLPPSIFLMSYDTLEMEYETIISECCIFEAVFILCGIIIENEQFNHEYDENIKVFEVEKTKQTLTNTLNFAYKRLKNRTEVDDKIKDVKKSIEKINNRFQKSKRKYLIDESSMIEIVNYYLLKKEQMSSDEFKEYKETLEKYTKYIDENELNKLIHHISSYFKKDLSSIHYRESFNLPTYVDYNIKDTRVSVNPYKNDHQENPPINKPAYVTDETPMFSMIMELAQRIKEEHEERLNINTKRIDKPISMVGFGIKRKTITNESEEKTIIDKYAKTFIGKTALQAICDLRINGWAYKLDAICGTDDSGRKIYYNIIPLTKFLPNLRKKYSGKSTNIIENNNEPRNRR